MTSYNVRNDKLTVLTWNNPRYQIFSLKNITKRGIVVVYKLIISNFIDTLKKCQKLTSIMTSHVVRNYKLTILTWNNPRYQILSLKSITKGDIVVVCRSIISNYIDILRKMSKNDVNNDVMWRQKWEIDYFDMK